MCVCGSPTNRPPCVYCSPRERERAFGRERARVYRGVNISHQRAHPHRSTMTMTFPNAAAGVAVMRARRVRAHIVQYIHNYSSVCACRVSRPVRIICCARLSPHACAESERKRPRQHCERAATALQAVRTCFALGRAAAVAATARARTLAPEIRCCCTLTPVRRRTALCIKCAWHAHWRKRLYATRPSYVRACAHICEPVYMQRSTYVCAKLARARGCSLE